jgi:hypothetical protein
MEYEDRYTMMSDFAAEDEEEERLDDDYDDIEDEELLEPARPAHYTGRHRAGIF